jgi:xanthine dehydrogenase molybdopterin-binding subunit B
VPPARRRRKPSHVKKCNRSSQLPEGERNACRRVLDRGINPDGVRNQIEGGVIQTVSRTLIEELKFDRSRVTSLDWSSYPILTFPDAPDVMIDLIAMRPERACARYRSSRRM